MASLIPDVLQTGLSAIAKLCSTASTIRLHALQRGQPLHLGALKASLDAACSSASLQLTDFVGEAARVVAAACQQTMSDLHARLEAFTQQQVWNTPTCSAQGHASQWLHPPGSPDLSACACKHVPDIDLVALVFFSAAGSTSDNAVKLLLLSVWHTKMLWCIDNQEETQASMTSSQTTRRGLPDYLTSSHAHTAQDFSFTRGATDRNETRTLARFVRVADFLVLNALREVQQPCSGGGTSGPCISFARASPVVYNVLLVQPTGCHLSLQQAFC